MSNYMKQKRDVFLKYGTGSNALAGAIIRLTEELEEVCKDKARLDWLFKDQEPYITDNTNRAFTAYIECRGDIDALMEAEVIGLGGNRASKTKTMFTVTTGLQWPEDSTPEDRENQ